MAPTYTTFQMYRDTVLINKIKLHLKDSLAYNSFVIYFLIKNY